MRKVDGVSLVEIDDFIANSENLIVVPRYCNLMVQIGSSPQAVRIELRENKSLIRRVQWWLFCKVFPLKIVKWERLDD